ncbi:MAG: adenylate/guanylate cyclase domain-containing protein [Candidatus Tectomicrobia bacterium]|uniref:Adenylate/guanylate cyclase domain-containing protein n=1 Tax=Tectimicrobiota bacterium TaxID=2528274 RepID=A0A932HXA2_UNCTE|nr:adenylate/guanylate cyclase domain-containing protein [Candidatus Tectomicrobia bacterium]
MDHGSGIEIELINEKSIRVQAGQSLLEAALEHGIPHLHACGGNARCSTCRVLVEEGEEYLSPPTEGERALAGRMGFPPGVRLACQAQVRGAPMRLHRLIRDKGDMELFLKVQRGTRGLGEEKDLAFLFLDVRDFTPFAETHLPFDVIHVLSRFHSLVREAIVAGGGRILSLAGDGVYAVFGLEAPLAEATSSAVRAGLRILEEVEAFNGCYLETYFGHRLAVGIGLHAGAAICGEVGAGEGGSFTAIGFSVNVASRLESATKEVNNSFLVSEAAFSLLADAPPAAGTCEVALRGVTAPCRVFLLGRPYR